MLVPVYNTTHVAFEVLPGIIIKPGKTYVGKVDLDKLSENPVFNERIRRGLINIEGWKVDNEAVKQNSQPHEANKEDGSLQITKDSEIVKSVETVKRKRGRPRKSVNGSADN